MYFIYVGGCLTFIKYYQIPSYKLVCLFGNQKLHTITNKDLIVENFFFFFHFRV